MFGKQTRHFWTTLAEMKTPFCPRGANSPTKGQTEDRHTDTDTESGGLSSGQLA